MSEAKKLLQGKLQKKLQKDRQNLPNTTVVNTEKKVATKAVSSAKKTPVASRVRTKKPSTTTTKKTPNASVNTTKQRKTGTPARTATSTAAMSPTPSNAKSSVKKTTAHAKKQKTPQKTTQKSDQNNNSARTFVPPLKTHINEEKTSTPLASKKTVASPQTQVKKTEKKITQKKPRLPLSPKQRAIRAHRIRLACIYSVALAMVVIDQLTKQLADSLLINGVVHVFSWLDLWLVYNPGAAFSLFAQGTWQRPFLVGISLIVSIALLFWIRKTPHDQRILIAALVCVLGGALGNLIDRVIYGYVIDFVSLHYQNFRFPTFNLADSFISVGAFLLVVDMLLGKKSRRNSQSSNAFVYKTKSTDDPKTMRNSDFLHTNAVTSNTPSSTQPTIASSSIDDGATIEKYIAALSDGKQR